MRIYYWIWGDPSSKIELQPYCGGTTVVAADSEEEAKELIICNCPNKKRRR